MKPNNTNYGVDEALGVLNTSESAFNMFIQRIVEDTVNFPNVGTEIKEEETEEVKAKHNFYFNIHDTRAFIYNNTGLNWLPSLRVIWIKTDTPGKFGGYAFNNRTYNVNAIVIIILKYLKKDDYEDAISHEVRHLYT